MSLSDSEKSYKKKKLAIINAKLNERAKQRQFIDFCKHIQPPEEQPAAHHEYIIDKLQQVERGEIKRLMIFAPPGSAKSTYASKLFPAWYLGKNKTEALIGASYSGDLATLFGRRIRNLITTPEYKDIFPDIELSADSKGAGEWETNKGGRYYAAGAGGAITGHRADGAIIDDPVKGREEALSMTIREKMKEWYRNDFWTRLKPDAWIIIIMTRWHLDDLAGWLLEEEKKGGEKWEVVSLPMEAEDDDVLGRKKGEPLWKEWFTNEMRDEAKRSPHMWQALYQCHPVAEGGGTFKRGWLKYYETVSARGMNVAILVDPADSKAKTADYTCFMVIALGEDRNYYVIDVVRDRLNLKERTETLFRLHRRWKPQLVGYEKIGMQADIQHIEDKQESINYRFNIVPFNDGGSRVSKESRIERLVPLFADKRIWLPEQGFIYVDTDGVPQDVIRIFVEEEYLAFPVSKNDDMLDCLSKIYDPDFDLDFPDNGTDGYSELEDDITEGGWMSA